MEQPIDVRALEEAVLIFYSSNSNEQAAAHEWLTRVQCSRQAWSFVWDLMAPNKVSGKFIDFFRLPTQFLIVMVHSHLKYNFSVPLRCTRN